MVRNSSDYPGALEGFHQAEVVAGRATGRAQSDDLLLVDQLQLHRSGSGPPAAVAAAFCVGHEDKRIIRRHQLLPEALAAGWATVLVNPRRPRAGMLLRRAARQPNQGIRLGRHLHPIDNLFIALEGRSTQKEAALVHGLGAKRALLHARPSDQSGLLAAPCSRLRQAIDIRLEQILDGLPLLGGVDLQLGVRVALQVEVHPHGGGFVGQAGQSCGAGGLGARASGAQCSGGLAHSLKSSKTH
ncbi:unnamed protein product [Wuchereria bancrofti]|uniref:Uncharacterized protein n=1 Tax=Wuchereria bancrofti TaxID=6293 RepID=A0A3P7DQQ0_WUCBA|nr:unnamed protein product [Wuchereria bancrofti]